MSTSDATNELPAKRKGCPFTRQSKRMNLDSSETSELFWLVDGNIILSAFSEHTDDNSTVHKQKVLFRVHRSLLARQSKNFSDTFGLPKPSIAFADASTPVNEVEANLDELYEGLPVINMPDSAEDIDCLLKVLYDPWTLPFKKYDPDTSLEVSRILSMATKYQLGGVRERIVSHVLADWPSDIREWNIFEQYVRAVKEGHYNVDEVTPEPVSAINLAKQFDIPQILPAAFYTLSCIKIMEDYDNRHELESDSGDSDSKDSSYYVGNDVRTARWRSLSAEDFRSLCRGREALENCIGWYAFSHKADAKCMSSCKDAFAKLVDMCLKDARETRNVLAALGKKRGRSDQLCSKCYKHYGQQAADHRSKIWDELPIFFGLN